jgi:hypothetical protein
MRVEVRSIGEYIAEVRASVEAGSALMEDCVRFRIDKHPQQKEAISFDVQYHVTAVVQDGADRYILDLTEYAGEDDGLDRKGTQEAERAREELREAIKEQGLTVRHGKIEVL